MRKALEVSGVTALEMSEYLDISRFTVSRYINGKADAPLQAVRLWALRTGVPFEWLQTGKTPDPDHPDGGSELLQLDSNQQPFD
ncbi:helix-turn-helix domain-containing protein [Corynebacterium kalidii]